MCRTDGRTKTRRGQICKDDDFSEHVQNNVCVPGTYPKYQKTYVPAKRHKSFSSITHAGLEWETTTLMTGTELDKMWYVRTVEYHSGTRRNKS